jgi:hypothetical protein
MRFWYYTLLLGTLLLVCGVLIGTMPLHTVQSFTLGNVGREVASGFHDAEVSETGRSFRWTDEYSRLVLEPQGTGLHRLSLTAAAPRPEAALTSATVTINQLDPVAIDIPTYPRRYMLLVPPDSANLYRNIAVIQSETFRSPHDRDRRELGSVIFDVEWGPIKAQTWLLPLQLLALTFACTSFLLLLIRAGLSSRWTPGFLSIFALLTLTTGHIATDFSGRWYAALLTLALGSLLWLVPVRRSVARTVAPTPAGRIWQFLPGMLALIGFCIAYLSWQAPLWPLLPLLLLVGFVAAQAAGVERAHMLRTSSLLALTSRALLPLFAVILFTAYFTLYLNCSYTRCTFTTYPHPPIRSDGVGYYSYLPAIFIDYDLTMQTRYQRAQFSPSNSYGISPYQDTDRYLNKYSIGVAVMMLPFFLVGHILTLVTGPPTDGTTIFYQFAVGMAGVWYALLGLLLLKKALERCFSRAAVLLTLVCVLFGTNLFHYATFDVTFSHAFSFCLFAALLFLLPRWYAKPSFRTTALLALVCGLVVLVRVPNIIVWLFVPLYGIIRIGDVRERLDFFLAHRAQMLALGGMVLVILLPQVLYWYYITGHWLLNPYQSEGFRYYLEPHIFGTLFGIQRGLFVWSPVLLLVMPGLWLLRRQASAYLLPILLYLPLITYIIASWHAQGYGASYGHRVFVDSLSILAFPLAAFFDSLRSTLARTAVTILVSLLIGLSLTHTWQYWQGEIDEYRPTWREYTAIARDLT